MMCNQSRANMAAFLMGQLDYRQHLAIESHLESCPRCAQEAAEMRADLSRITTAMHTRLIPPASMLPNLSDQLGRIPAKPRRRRWTPVFVLAAALAIFAMFVLVRLQAGSAQFEAQSISKAKPLYVLMEKSPQEVAAYLANRTRTRVSMLPLGIFAGGGVVNMGKNEIPFLAYDVEGTRIQCYEFPPETLQTSGMRVMEMDGRRFYCCSSGSGSLVAIAGKDKSYLFAGPVDEKSLAMIAARQVS